MASVSVSPYKESVASVLISYSKGFMASLLVSLAEMAWLLCWLIPQKGTVCLVRKYDVIPHIVLLIRELLFPDRLWISENPIV